LLFFSVQNKDKLASIDVSGALGRTAGVPDKTAAINDHPGSEFTLQRIVNNRPELEHFRAFLADNFAGQDLTCWLDIDELRRVPDQLRAARIRLVVRKYFNDDYFYGPTSPASKHQQDEVIYLLNYLLT